MHEEWPCCELLGEGGGAVHALQSPLVPLCSSTCQYGVAQGMVS